jgi:hypothetical protein
MSSDFQPQAYLSIMKYGLHKAIKAMFHAPHQWNCFNMKEGGVKIRRANIRDGKEYRRKKWRR